MRKSLHRALREAVSFVFGNRELASSSRHTAIELLENRQLMSTVVPGIDLNDGAQSAPSAPVDSSLPCWTTEPSSFVGPVSNAISSPTGGPGYYRVTLGGWCRSPESLYRCGSLYLKNQYNGTFVYASSPASAVLKVVNGAIELSDTCYNGCCGTGGEGQMYTYTFPQNASSAEDGMNTPFEVQIDGAIGCTSNYSGSILLEETFSSPGSGDWADEAWSITVEKLTVRVTMDDPQAAEAGPDSGSASIVLAGPIAMGEPSLTVGFTMSGTASSSEDYILSTTSALFDPGVIQYYIYLTPKADNWVEGNETAALTLTLPASVAAGIPISGSFVIADDPPKIAIGPDSGGSESDPGNHPVKFYVHRTGGDITKPLDFYYRLGGSATRGIMVSTVAVEPRDADYIDWNYVPGTGICKGGFQAGEDFAYIVLSVLSDPRYENVEYVEAHLLTTEEVNAANPAQYIITEPDAHETINDLVLLSVGLPPDNPPDRSVLDGLVEKMMTDPDWQQREAAQRELTEIFRVSPSLETYFRQKVTEVINPGRMLVIIRAVWPLHVAQTDPLACGMNQIVLDQNASLGTWNVELSSDEGTWFWFQNTWCAPLTLDLASPPRIEAMPIMAVKAGEQHLVIDAAPLVLDINGQVVRDETHAVTEEYDLTWIELTEF